MASSAEGLGERLDRDRLDESSLPPDPGPPRWLDITVRYSVSDTPVAAAELVIEGSSGAAPITLGATDAAGRLRASARHPAGWIRAIDEVG